MRVACTGTTGSLGISVSVTANTPSFPFHNLPRYLATTWMREPVERWTL